MSWQAHRSVTYYSKMTAYAPLRLLHFLADHASPAGLIDPAPSQETMAGFLNCTSRTIRNHIAALIESGELVCVRAGRGPGAALAYRINLAAVPVSATPAPTPPAAEKNPSDFSAILVALETLSARMADVEEKIASANTGNTGNNTGNNTGKISGISGNFSANTGNNTGKISGNSGNFSANTGKFSGNSGNGSVEYGAHDPGSKDPIGSERDPDPAHTRADWLDFFRTNNIPTPPSEREWEIVTRPGVTIWLVATSQWPGWELLDYLDTRLGNEPNRDLLQAAWTMWRAAGYRATNVSGILDWYENLCQNPTWRPGLAARPDSGQKMATSDYLTTNPLVANEWSL